MLSNVSYDIVNGCWVVPSCCDSSGYPVISICGVRDRAHRHFYRAYHGDIPVGKIIRHVCDNKKCVNPEHLLIGEHKDNVADRVSRNRSACGMANGRSKLKDSDVIFIFLNSDTPKMTLAKHFGVDPKVIRDIKQRKTWRKLTSSL